MALKQHTLNGFTFFCEKSSYAGTWHHTWYFKPTNCRLKIECPSVDFSKVRKADVDLFLKDSAGASAYYNKVILRLADVDAAQKRIDRAKLAVELTKSSDYDPGGSANNPAKVKRAMTEPRENLRRAEDELESALRVQKILAEGNRESTDFSNV